MTRSRIGLLLCVALGLLLALLLAVNLAAQSSLNPRAVALLLCLIAVAGLGLLKRGRPLLAGAAIGLAAVLQIFPALFLVPFAARALSGGRACAAWKLPAGAALSGLAAFSCATAGLGWGAWAQMLENLLAYLAVDAANAIGFRRVLATAGQLVDAATGRALSPVLGVVATLLSLLLALGVLLAARRRDRAPSLLAPWLLRLAERRLPRHGRLIGEPA